MRAFHISDSNIVGAIPAGDWSVFVLLASYDSPIDEVIQAVQEQYPEATVMGGITGSQLLIIRHGEARVFSQGVVGVCMRGNVPLYANVSRGVEPLSEAYTVQASHVVPPPDTEGGARVSALGFTTLNPQPDPSIQP